MSFVRSYFSNQRRTHHRDAFQLFFHHLTAYFYRAVRAYLPRHTAPYKDDTVRLTLCNVCNIFLFYFAYIEHRPRLAGYCRRRTISASQVIPFVPFVGSPADSPFYDTSIPDCGASTVDCICLIVGSRDQQMTSTVMLVSFSHPSMCSRSLLGECSWRMLALQRTQGQLLWVHTSRRKHTEHFIARIISPQ
jgi:hypothetical protein